MVNDLFGSQGMFGCALLAVVAGTVNGCGNKSSGNPALSKPYQAYVLQADGVGSDGRADFRFDVGTFKYLNDFESLDGPYMNIERGGSLEIKDVNGSLIEADSFEGGSGPQLRFDASNGVAVPRDYASLVMTSAYFQFDQIFDKLEDTTGVSLDTFFDAFEPHKITAFFEPKITLKSDNGSISQSIKLNAAYFPTAHQFLLFQRSAVENVPLAANKVVLAHEFGHALFDYAFFHNDEKPESRLSVEYAISGLNEGWADFVAYRYTGVSNILQSGIDIRPIYEDRNFGQITFRFDDLKPASNVDGINCTQEFYCLGTLFARSLVDGLKNLVAAGMTEKDFTLEMVTALRASRTQMLDASISKLPRDSSDIYDNMDTTSAWLYQGQVMGAFFNALLTGLSATTRGELCTQLTQWFGDKGFPSEARSGVCP